MAAAVKVEKHTNVPGVTINEPSKSATIAVNPSTAAVTRALPKGRNQTGAAGSVAILNALPTPLLPLLPERRPE